MKKKILFICMHNSARSQMAEGYLRARYGDRFEAFSCGTEITNVHPAAIAVMKEIGVDISHHTSKLIDEFYQMPIDVVVTVCDRNKAFCPFFPGNYEEVHFSFSDPSEFTGTNDEILAGFRTIRNEIAVWIDRTFGDMDIIERIRSQKALEQSNRKLSVLNSMTMSEIRTLFSSLQVHQVMIKDRVIDPSTQSIIEKEEIILRKIDYILKFSQLHRDLGFKKPGWQNVNHVFLMAISHLDFLRIKRMVQLDGLEIFADPLLEQVFQTLADNTLTHGKTATEVHIWYKPGPESLTLFFEDNGAGVPEKSKNEIFSHDFRNKKSIELFLAREILELTGISIQETGIPGKGVLFEMTVPKSMYRITKKSTKGPSGVHPAHKNELSASA